MQDHVVILIPGIREFGHWKAMLSPVLKKNGLTPARVNFGRFDLIRFLVPVPFFRSQVVRKVRRQIDDIQKQHPSAKFSVIAHSFGSWITAKILQEGFDIKFSRIIFCGSVVPYDFPFEQLWDRFDTPLLNDVGCLDQWPAVAESSTWGYGAAGSYGFSRALVEDRFHQDGKHGFFLTPEFCQKYWIPFLIHGKVVPPPFKKSIQNQQWWVRAISIIHIKYVGIAILAFLIVSAILYSGVPAPTPVQRIQVTVFDKSNFGEAEAERLREILDRRIFRVENTVSANDRACLLNNAIFLDGSVVAPERVQDVLSALAQLEFYPRTIQFTRTLRRLPVEQIQIGHMFVDPTDGLLDVREVDALVNLPSNLLWDAFYRRNGVDVLDIPIRQYGGNAPPGDCLSASDPLTTP